MKTFLQSAIDLFDSPPGVCFHWAHITDHAQWSLTSYCDREKEGSLFCFREPDENLIEETSRESQIYMLLLMAASRDEL